MNTRHNKWTRGIGCPYTWQVVPWIGAPFGRGCVIGGVSILSPMRVPAGTAKRFEFTPVSAGWPVHAIDLAPDEQLEYAMVREGYWGDGQINEPIHTIAVRVGKRGADGSLKQVTWLLPDGNGGWKIDLNTIHYEDLVRAGLVSED